METGDDDGFGLTAASNWLACLLFACDLCEREPEILQVASTGT